MRYSYAGMMVTLALLLGACDHELDMRGGLFGAPPVAAQTPPVRTTFVPDGKTQISVAAAPMTQVPFPSSRYPRGKGKPWQTMHEDGYVGSLADACILGGLTSAQCTKYERMVSSGQCRVMILPNGVVLDRLIFSKSGKHFYDAQALVDLQNPISRDATVCDIGGGIIFGRVHGCNNYFRVNGTLRHAPQAVAPPPKPKPQAVAPAPSVAPQPEPAPVIRAPARAQTGGCQRELPGDMPSGTGQISGPFVGLTICVQSPIYADGSPAPASKLSWSSKDRKEYGIAGNWEAMAERGPLYGGEVGVDMRLHNLNVSSGEQVPLYIPGTGWMNVVATDGGISIPPTLLRGTGRIFLALERKLIQKDSHLTFQLRGVEVCYPPQDRGAWYYTRKVNLAYGIIWTGPSELYRSFEDKNVTMLFPAVCRSAVS